LASTRADNVTHDRQDDTLTLRLGSENDRGKDYNGASVQTQDFFHFGIYEINMKASGVHGVNSNFFTFTGSQQGTIKNEIDFEFLGKTPTKVWTSFHSPIANDPDAGYKGRGKNVDLGFDASKDFHTYRFEWKPDSIKWYADGTLIRSVDPTKDTWLEDGEYKTTYNAANDGDTGAEIGIPQLPGKMYMNIWAGATQWMGDTPDDFKETTASYDNIKYLSWNHPDAKSLEGGKPLADYEVVETEEREDVPETQPNAQQPEQEPVKAERNEAPDTQYDTAVVEENGSVKIDVLGNDSDADGDALRVSNVANVTNGKVKINDDGTVTFTPDEDFSGRVDFSYTVTDGKDSSTGWVGVDVQGSPEPVVEAPEIKEEAPVAKPAPKVKEEAPAPEPVIKEAPKQAEPRQEAPKEAPVQVERNDAPDAVYDTAMVKENGSVKIDLLANDKDVNNDALRITNVANVSNGKVNVHDDGTVTFTPNEGFSGRENFSYTISDGEKTDKAWVGVDVEKAPEPVVQEPEIKVEAPAPKVEEAPVLQPVVSKPKYEAPKREVNDNNTDIVGTSGADRLRGSAQDDVFMDTAGQDRMWGSGGNDTFVFSKETAFDGKDLIKDFASGDTVDISDLLTKYDSATGDLSDFVDVYVKNGFTILSVDSDGNANFKDIAKIQNTNLGDDVENLVYQDVLDIGSQPVLHGGSPNQASELPSVKAPSAPEEVVEAAPVVKSISGKIMLGGGGRDTIKGTDGDDVLNGKTGDDIKDKLYGNDGDDVLIGGYNDVLTGGAGNDTFVLQNGSTKHTRIEDFTLGKDMIDISDVLKGVDPVDDMISDFVSIETNANKGKTYLAVDQDGDGGASAQIVAQVDGLLDMNVADLMASDSLIV